MIDNFERDECKKALLMLIEAVEAFLKRKIPISTLRRAVKEARKEVER